jgi:hypothetical protein
LLLGLWQGRNIMVEGTGRGTAYLEARKWKKGVPFKGAPPLTYFLQLGLTFQELIQLWIHHSGLMSQSSSDGLAVCHRGPSPQIPSFPRKMFDLVLSAKYLPLVFCGILNNNSVIRQVWKKGVCFPFKKLYQQVVGSHHDHRLSLVCWWEKALHDG